MLVLFVLSCLLSAIVNYSLFLLLPESSYFFSLLFKRGIINYLITFVGWLGILFSLGVIIKQLLEFKSFKFKHEIFLTEFWEKKIKYTFRFLNFFSYLTVSLGFLGTVYGLSVGISKLSLIFGNEKDLTMIKLRIMQLVSGLSVAFDSTLLGLIYSLSIATIITVGQRFVEKFVIDSYVPVAVNSLKKKTTESIETYFKLLKELEGSSIYSISSSIKEIKQTLQEISKEIKKPKLLKLVGVDDEERRD